MIGGVKQLGTPKKADSLGADSVLDARDID